MTEEDQRAAGVGLRDVFDIHVSTRVITSGLSFPPRRGHRNIDGLCH